MGKKLLTIFLCIALCMGLATTAMAQGEISPRFQFLTRTTAKLTSAGIINVSANGNNSVTRIEITVSVQEKDGSSWVDVDNWSTETTYNVSADFSDSTSVMTSGGTYRVKAFIKAYADGGSESTTKYSTSVTAR